MSEYVKLSEIVLTNDIYPRKKPENSKIFEYKELIEDGVKFPPIVVNKRTMHLIDGYHRYKACKSLGFLDIEVEFIDIPEEFEWLEAIYRNTKHGIPLKRSEIKAMFEKHFLQAKGKVNAEEFAEKLGVSKRTIYRWIEEFEQKHEIKREKETFKLSEEDKQKIVEMYESENYTREEIAEKFDITPDYVNQIVKQSEKVTNVTSSLNLTPELTENNKPVNEDEDKIIEAPVKPVNEDLNTCDNDDDDAEFTDDSDDVEVETTTSSSNKKPAATYTASKEEIAKELFAILNKALEIFVSPERLSMVATYMRSKYPQIYLNSFAETLRSSIPNLHAFIGELFERR